MPLFQRAPATPAEVEAARPGALAPDQVLDLDEHAWYEQVYRGDDVPQLTVRAVLMGSILGFLLAFTNLYVGLMTGWGLGVALTACIVSYAVWTLFERAGLAATPMTVLENNCMQSTASAAGYSTGSTIVSAIPALLMLSATPENPGGQHMPWPTLMAWTFCIAGLGVTLAIPMKRSMINRERLRFPSGTAAAVTLHSLYSAGDVALRKARVLGLAALGCTAFPLALELNAFRGEDGKGAPLLPAHSALFDWLPGAGTKVVDGQTVPFKPSDWTVTFDHNPVMIAAGMIIGLRITTWMLLGGVLLAWVVGPFGWTQEWNNPATGELVRATTAPHKAWKEIGIWLGVPIMISSSLLAFALQWRTILRAIQGMSGGPSDDHPLAKDVEVPTSWFAWGMGIFGSAIIALAVFDAGVPALYALLAVVLTFALSLVACRATGESDVTPIGAMGKMVQLTFGVLMPQSVTANIMTANITSNAAISSADLLNDLKSGYLLGASPRRQFAAQAAGIVTGTIATVVGFRLLVPDATLLTGTDTTPARYPAPAAQSWKAVAELFKYGLEGMHPVYQQAIALGLLIGAVLVIAETALPRARAWLPSATGLGLGLILPFQYPLSMFLGAVLAALWTRQAPEQAEDYLIPVASGVIAGVSLMGVLVAFLNNLVLT